MKEIPPHSGVAFALSKGEYLKIIDPNGEQVADFLAYNRSDMHEVISSGRSIDEAENIYLTSGSFIYSNYNNIMLKIIEDTVGRHDFLLPPCKLNSTSLQNEHHRCFENLVSALSDYSIGPDHIPVAFNVFMNVNITSNGAIIIRPPLSKAGDYILLEAKMDLIIGLTACADGITNNYSLKPIHYEIV